MKEVKEDNPEYKEIPKFVRYAVNYLNSLLHVNPLLITELLDHGLPYDEPELDMVGRTGADGDAEITAFGILAGLVKSKPYRIAMQWDNDDASGPINRFCIMKED
jgi:hypothetical protein